MDFLRPKTADIQERYLFQSGTYGVHTVVFEKKILFSVLLKNLIKYVPLYTYVFCNFRLVPKLPVVQVLNYPNFTIMTM